MHRGGIIDIQSLPLDAASQQQLVTHKFSLLTPPQVLLFCYETCALKSTVTLGEDNCKHCSVQRLPCRREATEKNTNTANAAKAQNCQTSNHTATQRRRRKNKGNWHQALTMVKAPTIRLTTNHG